MISLPQLSEQPPRGEIPASDLIPGDVIMAWGYPADVRCVEDLGDGVVRIRWGDHHTDTWKMCGSQVVKVIGWCPWMERP